MSYDGVMRLAKEHRDWLLIVKAAYEAAEESMDGEFAGKRIFEKVGWAGWRPGYKFLEGYGILKYEYSTRGKRSAHYTMPNAPGVYRALRELRII